MLLVIQLLTAAAVTLTQTNAYTIDVSSLRWSWSTGGRYDANTAGYFPEEKGVFSDMALPPAREQFASDYHDQAELFYVFGGWNYDKSGNSVLLNAVWVYNFTLNQWAWVAGGNFGNNYPTYPPTKGVSTATATPGGRTTSGVNVPDGFVIFGSLTAHDYNGRMAELNDVWKFTFSTSQWTWLAGASQYDTRIPRQGADYYGVAPSYNVTAGVYPGSRSGNCWVSSNNGDYAYLSGGYGLFQKNALGRMNDVWQFDFSTNTWSYLYGSTVILPATFRDGNYSLIGIEDAAIMPRRRRDHACSFDSANEYIYVFGGSGRNGEVINDLVKFNVNTTYWTYIGGSNLPDSVGAVGTVNGEFESTNLPSARYGMSFDYDEMNGNLFIYGGLNNLPNPTDDGTTTSADSDLWLFNTTEQAWARLQNSSTGSLAVYYTQGSSCDKASPGVRAYADIALSGDGSKIMLFGGYDPRALWDYSDFWTLQNVAQGSACIPQDAYVWPTQAPNPTQLETDMPPPPRRNGAMVGAVIGGLLGCFALVGVAVWCMKRKAATAPGGVTANAPPPVRTQEPATQKGPYTNSNNGKLEFATIDPEADE